MAFKVLKILSNTINLKSLQQYTHFATFTINGSRCRARLGCHIWLRDTDNAASALYLPPRENVRYFAPPFAHVWNDPPLPVFVSLCLFYSRRCCAVYSRRLALPRDITKNVESNETLTYRQIYTNAPRGTALPVIWGAGRPELTCHWTKWNKMFKWLMRCIAYVLN